MSEEKSSQNKSAEEHKIPVLEWIAAAVGFVLVSGAIGFVFYQALFFESKPPNISITIESVTPNDAGYLVAFKAANDGDKTAASVAIEGELKSGDESVEKSGVTIGYVPSYSETNGGLFFSKNPQEFDLKIRATGYQQP